MTKVFFQRQLFQNNEDIEFSKVIHTGVDQYLKKTRTGKYANSEMIFKTMVMFATYLIPYFFIISGMVINVWVYYSLMIMMGFGGAGIGFTVMHDANHGAYSKRKWINNLMGLSLDLLGGNSTTWKIQHNLLHHISTNVDGFDEDISPGALLRFSPHSKKYKFHKFQHIYAWFLYSLVTLNRLFFKEFNEMLSYSKAGLVQRESSVARALSWMILTKSFYLFYILILPVVSTPFTWWQVVLGFLMMHLVTGFLMSIVFQVAHVVDVATFPLPNEQGMIEKSWWNHQLRTTCNFANNNKMISWVVGGLNFQIEHHLFPGICHVHYPNLSQIIKQAAIKSNLPYLYFPSFGEALVAHGRMLKSLAQ